MLTPNSSESVKRYKKLYKKKNKQVTINMTGPP